jgi:hypothetical protein
MGAKKRRPSPNSRVNRDQRQAALLVVFPHQTDWRFRQNHLQRWPHVRLQQMAAHCRAIPLAATAWA